MSSAIRSIRFLPGGESLDRQRYKDGEIFYDRPSKTIRVFDGNTVGGFKLATQDFVTDNASSSFVSATAPTTANPGNIWFNTDQGKIYVYYNNLWVEPAGSGGVASGITIEEARDAVAAMFLNGAHTGISFNHDDSSDQIGAVVSISYNNLLDKPTLFSGSYNDLTDKPTIPSLAGYATETYVNTAVSNLVDAAPTALNTLNELAAALGDDANFATTVSTAIGSKEPAITAGTAGQYWRGDKTWQTLDKTAVGLGNVTNESKATMFTSPTFTGTTTLQQTTEVINTKTGATGTVTHDFSTTAIWYHSSIASNFTANFTNIPVTDRRISVCTLILNQGAAAYIPNGVEIGGVAQTINWLGGSVPAGTANKKDIVSFTIIRSDLIWTVLGSLSSYG